MIWKRLVDIWLVELSIFNQAKTMLYREFPILYCAALVVAHDDDFSL